MRKWKICGRTFALSAEGESGRATKRKGLLQYPRYGHVSQLFGDFKADVVPGFAVCYTQSVSVFRVPLFAYSKVMAKQKN